MTQPLRRLFTQARKAKRWSQTQAAQKAGLSLTIVFKSEMQLVTQLHTALALCRIYDIPLDTLAACYWYEVENENRTLPGRNEKGAEGAESELVPSG